jgi:hypothetical protein
METLNHENMATHVETWRTGDMKTGKHGAQHYVVPRVNILSSQGLARNKAVYPFPMKLGTLHNILCNSAYLEFVLLLFFVNFTDSVST